MYRYRITLEYLGNYFHGWQKQPEKISVQETLEKALFKFSNQEIQLIVGGRTDAGVHALGQVAHFDLPFKFSSDKLVMALNFHLSKEYLGNKISVVHSEEVSLDFHARFSAKRRRYRYEILNRFSPSAINQLKVWWVVEKLDINKIREAAKYLLGKHDFSSFRSKGCQSQSPVKSIESITVYEENNYIYIDISARSFLYNQVRIIVGTLRDVGNGKIKNTNLLKIIDKKDRNYAGPTAPSRGLTLMGIDY